MFSGRWRALAKEGTAAWAGFYSPILFLLLRPPEAAHGSYRPTTAPPTLPTAPAAASASFGTSAAPTVATGSTAMPRALRRLLNAKITRHRACPLENRKDLPLSTNTHAGEIKGPMRPAPAPAPLAQDARRPHIETTHRNHAPAREKKQSWWLRGCTARAGHLRTPSHANAPQPPTSCQAPPT